MGSDERGDRQGGRRDAADDTRRWGYDPAEDTRARGVAQDERQFGGDRGWGGYDQDRRGDADTPGASRGRFERFAGRPGPQGLGWHGGGEDAPPGRMPDHGRPGAEPGAPGSRPGSRERSYQDLSYTGRQGAFLGGHDPRGGDSAYGTTRGGSAPAGGDRVRGPGPRDDDGRPGLAGQSLYGPGDWGGRDGMAGRHDDDPARRDARRGDEPMGDGGYGGPTGVGGMGSQGPWGPGAGRAGRSNANRRGGVGGYGGGHEDAAGLGDMGGFGGLGHPDDEDEHGVRDPGGAHRLAQGSGGSGDWQASAYGSGQRRGLVDAQRPYRPEPSYGPDRWPADQPPQQRFGGGGGGGQPTGAGARFGGEHYGDEDPRSRGPRETAPGRSYGGWSEAGSMQGHWNDAARGEPAPAPRPPADRGPANRGPKGWKRSDERIHDDVCDRLSRAHGIDTGDVEVAVTDGHVTLSGTVADRRAKHAIEDLVDAVPGVQDIDNRIKVMRGDPQGRPDAPPTPRPSVPQDSPTARDEAAGRTSRPTRDGSGYYG